MSEHSRERPVDYPKTPELDKMLAVKEESQAIGEFLDWGQEQGMVMCRYSDRHGEFVEVPGTIEKLLAEYFEISTQGMDDERRAVLEWQRTQNMFDSPPIPLGEGVM